MFKRQIVFILILAIVFNLWPQISRAASLRGMILLEVEKRGEAWYVNPADYKRYYLGRPAEALNLVKRFGLGVNQKSLNAIQASVPERLIGKILINVEDLGKAYYINPRDRKIYYLGSPVAMFNVMRSVGLGIKTSDLELIAIGSGSQAETGYSVMEKNIQNLINDQRAKNGLSRLKWNDQVAEVARNHSIEQANENRALINSRKLCSYPFIHHEGLVSGLYHSDRLSSHGVYYLSASAENIALIPRSREASYIAPGVEPKDCQAEVNRMNTVYEEDVTAFKTNEEKIARLKQEIADRASLTSKSPSIQIVSSSNSSLTQIEEQAVTGWMNSPGHRRNILNGEYDEAGMGIAEVNGYFIITQVFIKRASCGYKGGACCAKPGYYPYCYIPWSCSANICK